MNHIDPANDILQWELMMLITNNYAATAGLAMAKRATTATKQSRGSSRKNSVTFTQTAAAGLTNRMIMKLLIIGQRAVFVAVLGQFAKRI